MDNVLEYLEKTEMEYGGRLAVDDGIRCLTWTELLELSRRLGTAFSRKAEPGRPIGILLEKISAALAAMFGAVYAGCFYVMIDPCQPPVRVREILRILEPDLIVTDEKGKRLLRETGWQAESCLLREAAKEEIDIHKLGTIRQKTHGTDLLYGIFTSGSTGTPKGIVVSHRAVIDFISHFKEIFRFTANDRVGNQAPFDFDVSVKDIYTCLMTGASLILIPKEMFSVPPVLLDYLCDKKITSLTWAVSALTLISSLKGLSYKAPVNVRQILFSGEVMPLKHLRLWQEALPDAEFANLYGPTEITCNCTYYPVKQVFEDTQKLPIGKPFPGRTVFLLDDSGKEICTPGLTGEICIAGESLSEGYYRSPAKTKEKFIHYTTKDGEELRCYKSGDLGYYGTDGELYFSGRKDFQVKHMGHRIELEEIEHAIGMMDGVSRSCCLMEEKKNRLTAFYTGPASPESVREQLKQRLPLYMIPHRMIQTSHIPLNKNGKIDRQYFRRKLEVNQR